MNRLRRESATYFDDGTEGNGFVWVDVLAGFLAGEEGF